ncbi:hypothetical protein KKH56_04295 [bacterium]|nr:hypothetical protein [bacterium]
MGEVGAAIGKLDDFKFQGLTPLSSQAIVATFIDEADRILEELVQEMNRNK